MTHLLSQCYLWISCYSIICIFVPYFSHLKVIRKKYVVRDATSNVVFSTKNVDGIGLMFMLFVFVRNHSINVFIGIK
jgi:DNA polymerase sigma